MKYRLNMGGLLLVLAALMASSPLMAKEKYPKVSDDGLVLEKVKGLDAMYWQEGASLAGYTKVLIREVDVSFRKNWLRDQNSNRAGVNNRVKQEDMDRIRGMLAEEFHRMFTKELQENGNYTIVDAPGEDVLELRPAIVNLDVNAPDISRRQAGMSTTYTTSAGEMTLKMELYDAATGALIGRAIDRSRSMDKGYLQYTNHITNRVEADRILGRWARILRDAMDEANANHK